MRKHPISSFACSISEGRKLSAFVKTNFVKSDILEVLMNIFLNVPEFQHVVILAGRCLDMYTILVYCLEFSEELRFKVGCVLKPLKCVLIAISRGSSTE